MKRIATEDDASPQEALHRFEEHYGKPMDAASIAMAREEDPKEKLQWMLLLSNYRNWIATLTEEAAPRDAENKIIKNANLIKKRRGNRVDSRHSRADRGGEISTHARHPGQLV